METREFIKIPKERMGILIGPDGKIKATIEKETKTRLEIDGKEGSVFILSTEETDDPLAVWKARDIARAIGRGFSPNRAFRLLGEDELLEIVDLTLFTGKSKNAMNRIKGRIIGTGGKTRRIIEEVSGAIISVYGHTVAIIGDADQSRMAKEAIIMLIEGLPHSTVYGFLQKRRRALKRKWTSWKTLSEI
ncbi:MAG: KH domain-containing protein [Candidatus Jordarchaeum sp.]|uniref:KH domain-containing protein n=1 Tax=Candidatus Jordarchaeum sp. TaxID=2823881 RepID=UPI00404B9DDD